MKLLRSSGYRFHFNFIGDEKKTSTTTDQEGEKKKGINIFKRMRV